MCDHDPCLRHQLVDFFGRREPKPAAVAWFAGGAADLRDHLFVISAGPGVDGINEPVEAARVGANGHEDHRTRPISFALEPYRSRRPGHWTKKRSTIGYTSFPVPDGVETLHQDSI